MICWRRDSGELVLVNFEEMTRDNTEEKETVRDSENLM